MQSPAQEDVIVSSGYSHPHLRAIVERARGQGAIAVAVAYPCDAASIEAADTAARAGLIRPLLVGPRKRIEAAADQAGTSIDRFTIHETADDARAAAAAAVTLCREGTASALMKGSLHTDELLGAAVGSAGGLRGTRRASHVFVMDVSTVDRPLLMTDCVVNIAPTLVDKRDIVQTPSSLRMPWASTHRKLPILSAVETVNPAIQSTLDAAALCKMADRGQISGAVLDGPLAFDNAISAASARNKGIVSAVAGSPDILLMPSLEAGNMMYKQLVYLAGAECAGLVLGMKVPIILTSRSDSVTSRVASCALAVLVSHRMAEKSA